METTDVISALELLNIDNNKTKYFIGPEQKYISSLLNSGTNNLEENLKIGQNEIITRWYGSDDDNNRCYRETIEFRTDDITENYYFIEYYEYNTEPNDIDVTKNNEVLTLDAHNKMSNYTNISSSVIMKKYELYFKYSDRIEKITSKEINQRKIQLIGQSIGYCDELITNTNKN